MLDLNKASLSTSGIDKTLVRGEDEMIRLLVKVCEDLCHTDLGPTELLAVTDGRVAYHLRWNDLGGGFNIKGIVQVQTRIGFEDVVRCRFHQAMAKDIGEHQPGEWVLVAWRIYNTTYHRKARRKRTLGVNWQPFAEVPGREGFGQDRPQETEFVEDPLYRLCLEVAFADMSGADIIDPLFELNGKKNSTIHKYSETQDIKHMPKFLREERKQAAALIKQFYEHHGLAPANGDKALPARRKPGRPKKAKTDAVPTEAP